MTTSRAPKSPRKSGKSDPPTGGLRTPFTRRVKYLFQDIGHSLKKVRRRVTDPVRDARPRRERGEAQPRRPAKSTPKTASRRVRGARELGERPEEPGEKPARRPREKKERRPREKVGGAGLTGAITRFGERASRLIKGALAPLAGPLAALGALAGRAQRGLAAAVTPLRAVVAVTALAAILLAVSQFVDYRGVAVGAPDYSAYADVEIVAPAPQVDRQPAGSAHAYLLLPVAVIALAALAACLRGRWRFGRLVALLGVLAIAVTLIVDVPAGLDEGAQAVAYSGVEAKLIEGFYVQLVSAAILVAGGLLVARYARASSKRSPRPRRSASTVTPPRARAA